MEWPERNSATGAFVSTPTARRVWQRAADGALADMFGNDGPNAEIIEKMVEDFQRALKRSTQEPAPTFRFDYREILEKFTKIMASCDTEQALDMAQAGIDALHDQLLFRIDSATIVPAKDVFVLSGSFAKLGTFTLQGTKPRALLEEQLHRFPLGLTDPLNRSKQLHGVEACRHVDAWYEYGILETSSSVLAKTAMTATLPHIESVIRKKVFVLLGVTSELGPARQLLKIPGVTVLGVARPGKKLDDLKDYVRFESPDSTRLMLPRVRYEGDVQENDHTADDAVVGADLLLHGPQIAQWILNNTDEDKDELVLCPLAYADGEENVRVCAAMDLIVQRVSRQRPKHTMISQYVSPTTCMIVPPTCATIAQKRLGQRPSWEGWANTLSGGRWLKPSLPSQVDGIVAASGGNTGHNHDFAIVNGIVSAQGPNYALAKMLQMWRCMVAHYRDGIIVAAPFAPLCRTRSVVENHPSIAAAIEGMHQFEPLLALDPKPASDLMTCIFFSQLQHLHRPLPDLEEKPYTMFWDGAVHGGVWTCPYALESMSTINYVLGKTYYPPGYVPQMALPKHRRTLGDADLDAAAKAEDEVAAAAAAAAAEKNGMTSIMDDFADSQLGRPMPDCVKERLEFM